MNNFSDEKTRSGQEAGISRPPFTVDLLADEVRRFSRSRRPWPREVPRDALEAARWWCAHQKPASDSEAPRQVAVFANKSAQRWTTPYADRLIAALRIYLRLPQRDREFILAAYEDGVFWNGDHMDVFARIYEETQRMRSMGAKKYRVEAIGKLKRLIGAMT